MFWMDLQKIKIIDHEMALSRAILGQILAILRISDQKNDQPVFEGKSLLLPGNCLFDLKIGIQVLCNGSDKVTVPFF